MRASPSAISTRVRAMPGVRLVLTAADIAELGPLPTPGRHSRVPISRVPPYPMLAQGRGAPCRRCRRLRRRRYAGTRPRTRPRRSRRLAAAAACDRRRGGAAPARRRSGRTGRAISPSRPSSATRKHRGGLRQGRAHRHAHDRQPAAGDQLSRHPRRRRRIRRRAHHAHPRQPGQPHHPRHHRRRGAQVAAREDARRSRPMSAAASAPSCFPIANMRWPRSRPSACASR